jgi:hypothetical protein
VFQLSSTPLRSLDIVAPVNRLLKSSTVQVSRTGFFACQAFRSSLVTSCLPGVATVANLHVGRVHDVTQDLPRSSGEAVRGRSFAGSTPTDAPTVFSSASRAEAPARGSLPRLRLMSAEGSGTAATPLKSGVRHSLEKLPHLHHLSRFR